MLQRMSGCLPISTVLRVLHVLEIPRQPQQVPMFLWESLKKWRETQLPRTKEAETLVFKASFEFRISQDLANEVQESNILVCKSSD